jgi:hypothetical protein
LPRQIARVFRFRRSEGGGLAIAHASVQIRRMAGSRRTPFTTKRICIAVLFAIVVGIFIWRRNRPEEPPASVKFLSFTNDATGIRFASFTVTNLKPYIVRRQAGYWIELRTPVGQTNHLSLWFSNACDLNPQASETITVPVPTNQAPWRVVLPIRTDLGSVSEMIEEVRFMSPYKLPLPYPKSFELRSAWLEN